MTETVNKHTGHYDFGYRFREEFWGKGYATEGGKACLKHGMEQLKLQNIYAMTHIDNLASRRVLEKCGFTLIEIFGCDAAPNWQEANEPTTWYAYTASIQ
jgi:RimJ/RimL family protein N-acetyltransferase